MTLVLEMRLPGKWRTIGEVPPGAAPGSLSHNGPAGRQVYVFACHGSFSTVDRSLAGADVELGPMRAISSQGLEQVARLDSERPTFECWVKTDRMPEPQQLRFRHV